MNYLRSPVCLQYGLMAVAVLLLGYAAHKPYSLGKDRSHSSAWSVRCLMAKKLMV